MSAQFLLTMLALGLALVEEFDTHGRSIVGWAVVFLCLALLWGRL